MVFLPHAVDLTYHMRSLTAALTWITQKCTFKYLLPRHGRRIHAATAHIPRAVLRSDDDRRRQKSVSAPPV